MQRFSTNFGIFSFFFDMVIVAASLSLSIFIRPYFNPLNVFSSIIYAQKINILSYFFLAVVWGIVLFFFSVYDGKRNLKITDEFTRLTLGSFFSIIILSSFIYFFKITISPTLFAIFSILTHFSLSLWRLIARAAYQGHRKRNKTIPRILIVGAGPAGVSLLKRFTKLDPKTYDFVGFIDDPEELPISNEKILGSINLLKEIVKREKVDSVFVTMSRINNPKLNIALNLLIDMPIKIYFTPDIFDAKFGLITPVEFEGLHLLEVRSPALTESQRFTKRIFDIITTSLLLVPALPLMGIVALLVRIFDGRPILFIQNRVGENGRIIKIYKFRTMYVGAEKMNERLAVINEHGDKIYKSQNDPRVTPLGKILRKFSLDELPQLFNVMRGTLSLVGPRPELEYIVRNYKPWQRARLSIPQGLTGWWQIQGRSDKPMHLNTEYDLYYVENYSILLDISILLRTLFTVLRGKGAY